MFWCANGRFGREPYFSYSILSRARLCVRAYEHEKKRLQTQSQLEFSTKCSVTKISCYFVPFLTQRRFGQSHEMQCVICYFSLSTSCTSHSNRVEIEHSMVLHNVGKRSQCQCMRASTEHFISLASSWNIFVDHKITKKKKRLSHTFRKPAHFWSPFNED